MSTKSLLIFYHKSSILEQVKLTVNLKLQTSQEQHDLLLATMKRANEACNWISNYAFTHKVFQKFALHHPTYFAVREQFQLSSNVTCRCLGKVADAYKLNKFAKRIFRLTGSIAYDHNILSFKKNDIVSIWTLKGRIFVPFVMGDRQREYFEHRKGEILLVYRKKTFYLNVICDITEEPQLEPKDILGVDFGIVNIASDSDGEQFSGQAIDNIRQTFSHRRRNLQRKQTKGSKRKLKAIAGKQSRFQKNENHVISKRLVDKAKGTQRAISLEDLEGIRDRVTVKKGQRHRLNNWSFYDLRQKIEYKAQLKGVPVIIIDPRNTSKQCSVCSHISKSNRKSQSEFVCQKCGHTDNADFNASRNIRERAVAQLPNETQVSR